MQAQKREGDSREIPRVPQASSSASQRISAEGDAEAVKLSSRPGTKQNKEADKQVNQVACESQEES